MRADIKIFVVSTLLQELLDDCEHTNKIELMYHIKMVQNKLDELLSVPINTEELSKFLNDANKSLEAVLDTYLIEQENATCPDSK